MATYRVTRRLPGGGYDNHTFTPYGGSLNLPTKPILTGRTLARHRPSKHKLDALQVDLQIFADNNEAGNITTSMLSSGTNGSLVWYFSSSGDYPGSGADIFTHVGYGLVTPVTDSNGDYYLRVYGYDHRNGHPEGAVITNPSGSFTAKLTDGSGTTSSTVAQQLAGGYRDLIYEGFRAPSIAEDVDELGFAFFPVYMHLNTNSTQPFTHMSYPVYLCTFSMKQTFENIFPQENPTGIFDYDTSGKELRINNACIVRYEASTIGSAVDWKRHFAINLQNPDGNTRQYIFKMHGNGGPFTTVVNSIDMGAALENTSDGGTFMVEDDFVITPESSVKLKYVFNSYHPFYRYTHQDTPWDFQFVDVEGLETDLDTNTTAQDIREGGVIVKPLHAGEHCAIRHKFRGVGGDEGKTINFDVVNRFFALPNEADKSYTTQTNLYDSPTSVIATSDSRARTVSSNAPMIGDGFFDVNLIFRNVNASGVALEGEPVTIVTTHTTSCKLLDNFVTFEEVETNITPNRARASAIRVMPEADNWTLRFRVNVGGHYWTFDMSGTKKPDYGLQVWNEKGQTRLNSGTRNVKVLYSASGSGTSSVGTATVPELVDMSSTNPSDFGYSITTHNTRVKGELNYVNKSVDIIDQDMGNITAQMGQYFDTDDWHLIIFRR